MKLGGGVLVGAAGENAGHLIMDGEKALHLTRRLKALHDPLSSARRLVGILRSVIEMGWTAPIGINVPRCGSRRACRRRPPAMSITIIGLDTAKSVFQVHGVNDPGKPEIRRKLRRSEPTAFFGKQEA
jgi:hypothetical protein